MTGTAFLRYTGWTHTASSNNPKIIMLKSCITEPPCVPPQSNTSCAKAQDVPNPSPATEQVEGQGPTSNITSIVVPSVVEETLPPLPCVLEDIYYHSRLNVQPLPYLAELEPFKCSGDTILEGRKIYCMCDACYPVDEEEVTTIIPEARPSLLHDSSHDDYLRRDSLRQQSLVAIHSRSTSLLDQAPNIASIISASRIALNVADFFNRKDKSLLATTAFVVNLATSLNLPTAKQTQNFIENAKECFRTLPEFSAAGTGPLFIEPEALDDYVKSFAAGAKGFKKHLPNIIKKLLALVASASLAPYLLTSAGGSLTNIVGHLVKRKGINTFTVIGDIMDYFIQMISDGIDWLCNERIPTAVHDALKESKDMREEYTLVNLTMTDKHRTKWLNKYPSVHTKLVKLYTESFREDMLTLVNMIDRERELLVSAYASVTDMCFKGANKTLAMNFVGVSSIGKSLILSAVEDIFAFHYQGEPYDSSQIMTLGPSKYWDQATNEIRVIKLDDLGAGIIEGQKATDNINEKYSSLLISIVNPEAFTPAMAMAHLKGKIHPNPHAFLITSNPANQWGDIPKMRDPNAAARRVIQVGVKLRPEFYNSDGKGNLDVSLLTKSFYEQSPWLFTIRRYDLPMALAANDGVEKAKLYPELFEVDTIRTPISPEDISCLTDDETKTLSHIPNDDGKLTYSRSCKDVPFAVLRDWIVAELESYHDQGGHVDSIKALTRASNKKLDATVVEPEASIFGLDFFEQTECSNSWPLWVFCGGNVRHLGLDMVAAASMYSNMRRGGKVMWWLKILFRSFVLYPFGLFFARATGNAPSGFWHNFRAFYMITFINIIICISTIGSGWLSRYAMELAVDLCIPPGHYLRPARRLAVDRCSNLGRHKKLSRCIVGGIFGGLSLYALKSGIAYYNSLSSIEKELRFYTQPESDEKQEVPEPPAMPSHGGVLGGTPPTTNTLLRARSGAFFKGRGNLNDTTGRVQAHKGLSTMSFPDVLSSVQHNMLRLTVQPVDHGDLSVAKPVGPTACQFGLILGQIHTGAVVLLNQHVFNQDFDYYRIQVHWRKGQNVKPVIIPKAFVSFGSDLGPGCLGGSKGLLDIALIRVLDMGSVRDITNLFPVDPSYHETSMDSVKRLICPTMDGDYPHQAPLSLDNGDYVGVKTVQYETGHFAGSALLAACATGDGGKGMCGLPVLAGGSGRCVLGIHQGAGVPYVYFAPVTQDVIGKLWSSLQQKENPGCTPVHVVLGEPVMSADSAFVGEPLLSIDDKIPLHKNSPLRVIAPNAKYSFLGTTGKGGMSFYSEYKKNPHRRMIYDKIPLTKNIANMYSTPDPNIHLSHDKLISKTSPSTREEPFTLRQAYKVVEGELAATFMDLAVGENSFLTGLGPCGMKDAWSGFGQPLGGPMQLKTSAGTFPGAKSLHFEKIIDPDNDDTFIDLRDDGPFRDDMLQTIKYTLQGASLGITPSFTSKVVPKDEPREHQLDANGGKVKKLARVIHAGEVPGLTAIRIYFLPIAIVLGMAPIKFGHAVGLDPSKSFGDLHNHLTSLGEVNYFATDYSAFDMTISVSMLNAAVNLLISLTHMMSGYTDEHRAIMRTLCYDLCNPIYDIDGTLVRFTGSNSSGNPLTTILNCVVNRLMWNQAWLMWQHDTKSPESAGLYHNLADNHPPFSSCSMFTCMGDDFLCTIRKDCGFNQLLAVKYAARLGFTLTGAEKGAEVLPYAQSITFLKRDFLLFKRDDGTDFVTAPLLMTSLLRPLVWGTWQSDMIDHLAGLIKGMLIELVQHGPEIYADYVSQFREFIAEFYLVHKTGEKRSVIHETLASHFSEHDFRPWSERITEMYGNGKEVVILPIAPKRI